ncbi:MAG TPA: hypothetical protein PK812_04755 [Beijerinckiaceae bacterium]|nr:hypothetical protein [Beijerinckiaceae bacterium]
MAKKLNRQNLITMTSVAVLVGTEILAASLATGWAIGGLMQLGREVTWGIIAVSLAGGLWATIKFVQNALKVEPIYE